MWSMSHVLGHMWLPSSPVLRLASENSHSAGGWRETCRVWQTAQCAAATQTGHLVPQYVSARMAHELLPPAPWSGLSPRGSQELSESCALPAHSSTKGEKRKDLVFPTASRATYRKHQKCSGLSKENGTVSGRKRVPLPRDMMALADRSCACSVLAPNLCNPPFACREWWGPLCKTCLRY